MSTDNPDLDSWKWSPEIRAKIAQLQQLPHEEAVRQMLADESLRNVENDNNWPAEMGTQEQKREWIKQEQSQSKPSSDG